MNEWLLIAGMALVTFGVRYPMLAVVGRIAQPAWLIRALRYVPVAMLSAIIFPSIFMPHGSLDIHPANPYLVAAVASTGAAWGTKSLLWTILVGMGAFFLWKTVIYV